MPQPAGAFRVDINGLACASATRCVAVGEADNSVLIEHWNGQA